MAKPSLLTLSLGLILFFQAACAQRQRTPQGQCQIQRLSALEPADRLVAEAGETEFWDENNEQLQCAGVNMIRHLIRPNGLLLPSYTNVPLLFYIEKGRGMHGVVMPGCPETFQSPQEWSEKREKRSQIFQDSHQKIRQFRQGDIVAIPAGAAHWIYNDGDIDLVVVVFQDTNNNINQLDQNARRFYLAGNPRQKESRQQHYLPSGGEQRKYGNIFGGFDLRSLEEVFRVDSETARMLQGENDQRGHIVGIEGGLKVVRPPSLREVEEEQRYDISGYNGLEEIICTARLRENLGDPQRADIFNPQAGRLSTLNSNNLPILGFLQLSAAKGVLYRNAIMAPHWNLNAHCVMYVTRGEARVQVVDNRGQTVLDEQLRKGQLVLVPQNFAILKQAGNEGFEWVSFRTNDNAMMSTLVGRTSAIRGMPLDVIANAYRVSRDEAYRLKTNREETVLFKGSRRSERVATA